MISVLSWEFPGGAFDAALVGLGTRSVYNPIAALLLIHICGMIIFIEMVIKYCSWKYGKYKKKKEKEKWLKEKEEKQEKQGNMIEVKEAPAPAAAPTPDPEAVA